MGVVEEIIARMISHTAGRREDIRGGRASERRSSEGGSVGRGSGHLSKHSQDGGLGSERKLHIA